jgi:hypothetical protein
MLFILIDWHLVVRYAIPDFGAIHQYQIKLARLNP